MTVEGKRERGRPRLRWKYNIERDLRDLNLTADLAGNRKEWRRRIRAADPVNQNKVYGEKKKISSDNSYLEDYEAKSF